MPLSDHEQRLLDQIERQLYADDPKWANNVRATDLRTHLLRRMQRAVVALVIGILALLVGAIMATLVVGVAGFVVMLCAGLVFMRSVQRLGRQRLEQAGITRPAAPQPRTRTGLIQRIEERWKRRWDERER